MKLVWGPEEEGDKTCSGKRGLLHPADVRQMSEAVTQAHGRGRGQGRVCQRGKSAFNDPVVMVPAMSAGIQREGSQRCSWSQVHHGANGRRRSQRRREGALCSV